MRQRGLDHEEHREDVRLEGALQLLLGDVADVLVGVLLAGVVDEDVQPAKLLDGPPDHVVAMGLRPEVAGDGDGAAALALDDTLGLGRVVVLAQIGDRDVGALAGEQGGHRAADAAVRAGDDRDLASEAPGAGVTRLPLGLLLHLALVARKIVLVDHRLDLLSLRGGSSGRGIGGAVEGVLILVGGHGEAPVGVEPDQPRRPALVPTARPTEVGPGRL